MTHTHTHRTKRETNCAYKAAVTSLPRTPRTPTTHAPATCSLAHAHHPLPTPKEGDAAGSTPEHSDFTQLPSTPRPPVSNEHTLANPVHLTIPPQFSSLSTLLDTPGVRGLHCNSACTHHPPPPFAPTNKQTNPFPAPSSAFPPIPPPPPSLPLLRMTVCVVVETR